MSPFFDSVLKKEQEKFSELLKRSKKVINPSFLFRKEGSLLPALKARQVACL